MAVDKKMIAGEMHTVLINNETGRIAMLARTIMASVLQRVFKRILERTKINMVGF